MSGLSGVHRGFRAFLILVVSMLLVFVFQQQRAAFPLAEDQPTKAAIHDFSHHVVKRIGLPFGHDQPHNFSSSARDEIAHGPARIQKRGLSFFDAICKGEKHLANIARAALLNTAPGNRYTVQDLENAGWSIDSTFPLRIPSAMRPALEACNVGTDADTNKVRYADQNKEYIGIGGEQQQSTQGQYYQVYNPAGKAILCPDNASPAHFLNMMRQARDLAPITEGTPEFNAALPKIHRWNDVVWTIWADTAGGQAGSLQYIFRDNIANDDTKGIIEEAVAPLDMKTLPWPGKTFSQEEIAGQALMGTPHGAGIAWLLIENIQTLKNRDIEITVYSGKADNPTNNPAFNDKYHYYMLFNLKP